MNKRKFSYKILVWAVVLLFAYFVPSFTNGYTLTVVNAALIYFIGALGISVMMGMCGYMMLCSVAFMGLGGFLSANLCLKLGMSPALSIPISILAIGVVAGIIGSALVKLNGAFFAFATMGLTQITSTILNNYRPFSGGPDGMSKVPTISLFGVSLKGLEMWFYFLVVVCIVVGLMVARIRKTSLGRSMQSIRDNEVAAKTLGVNTYMTKIYAFIIGAMLAALSGCLLGHHNTVISARLFTMQTSIKWFIMVMLGGVNSTVGAFVGTLLVTFMPELFKNIGSYFMLLYGFGVVILMIFMPMGLAGLFNTVVNKIKMAFAHKGGAKSEADNS